MEDLSSDALLAQTTEIKGYKILPPCVLYARIGVGGMGAVYRGHHLNLDIDVAVKCLKPSLVADDPTFVDRFKREGRSAAQINHQNVIRVFDVAESLGLHYLIMEYVAGETARQRVERKGALDVPEALQIVYESSLGLGEAHRMGIIHRDIKPDNLLISSRGQVKVADLGLAKPAVSSGQSMLSMAGQVMGTPPYMPPEQWGEGTVTAASDVWAMGAVLYYLLTAREAMSGESLAAIMSKIVLQEFPDVRTLRPDVPDEVVQVMQKATAKEPGERYLDAYELADAIGQLPQHRISLADTDAGTTELRTMLSPPPNARINEIKDLLSKTPTIREAPPVADAQVTRVAKAKGRAAQGRIAQDGAAQGRAASRGRFGWVAVLLVLLLAGGGGAGYVYRDVLFGDDPGQSKPQVDALADVKNLRAEDQFVAALVAARAVFAAAPATMDEPLLAELRKGAESQLKAALRKTLPGGEVARGVEVSFVGRLVGVPVDELRVGGVSATFTGDVFQADLIPPADGIVAVQAQVTGEDLFDVGEWNVVFEAEVQAAVAKPEVPTPAGPDPNKPDPVALAPVAFAGTLTTEPKLGERNTVGQARIRLLGKATEGELQLRLEGELLDNVQWQSDGSFEVEVDLPDEGANTIKLTLARSDEPEAELRAEQIRSIEVFRLTEQPTIDLVSPSQAVSSTTDTEITLEVTADEWTKSVSARAGKQVVEFDRSDPAGGATGGKVTWRAKQALQLDDNMNSVQITARNLTDKVRERPLTITCKAKPLEITGITLAVAGQEVAVKPGATVFVNRQPEIQVALSDSKASILSGGKPSASRFPANLLRGKTKQYSIRAEKGPRESQLWTFSVVYDSKAPTITADRVAAVPPNSEVTLRGTFGDDFGVGSVAVRGGADAELSGANSKSGGWSTRVRVGSATTTLTVIAKDLAGNVKTVAVPVSVVQPKPAKPNPVQPNPGIAKPVVVAPEGKPTSKPAVKLSAKIDASLFTPVGDLNQKGFPPQLRHKTTGITLIAVNFVDTMDPSYYVAKRVISNQQWDGDSGSGTDPKVSVTWPEVARQVNSTRFEGLSMVTKQQWQMVRSSSTPGLLANEKAEWLAQDANDSLTMRAVANGAKVTMLKYNDSNAYVGFRVGFAPK
tara:strand:+ start:926 stop:4333 length:3408 start_codon:yes stop_codon:yes gene_type:complete